MGYLVVSGVGPQEFYKNCGCSNRNMKIFRVVIIEIAFTVIGNDWWCFNCFFFIVTSLDEIVLGIRIIFIITCRKLKKSDILGVPIVIHF